MNFPKARFTSLLLFVLTALPAAAADGEVTMAILSEVSGPGVDEGFLDSVETSAGIAVSSVPGYAQISRRHLSKVLQEHNLARANIVENHADIGRLLGAEVLLVLSITKNNVRQSHEDIAAFGIVERRYFVASEASISATAIEVDSGRVILRQQYEKNLSGSRGALQACLNEMKVMLPQGLASRGRPPAKPSTVFRANIRPTSRGVLVPGLDILVDGAFMGNTPLEMDLDEGVREVTLSQSGRKLWSNRLRVKKDVVISPELVFE